MVQILHWTKLSTQETPQQKLESYSTKLGFKDINNIYFFSSNERRDMVKKEVKKWNEKVLDRFLYFNNLIIRNDLEIN